MTYMNTLRLLVSFDEHAKAWVAQCVDWDLVTQAKKREDLPKAFGHVYFGKIIVSLENGETPKFRPAPKHIVERWNKVIAKAPGGKGQIIPGHHFVPDWAPKAFTRLEKKLKSARKAERAEKVEEISNRTKPDLVLAQG